MSKLVLSQVGPDAYVLLTFPIFRSSFCSSFAYLRSKSKSLAKSSTEVLTLPAVRKLASYPKVSILVKQTSGSRGRNFNGQNNSGSPFFDHVLRLAPPRPCIKTISTLWPFSGV